MPTMPVEAVGGLVEERASGRSAARPRTRGAASSQRVAGDESVARSPSATMFSTVDPALGHGRARCGESAEAPARQEGVERRRLDEAPTSNSRLRSPRPNGCPEELHPSAVRADEAREDAHRRGLARAVGAEEAVHHPGRHAEVEPVERATWDLYACLGFSNTGRCLTRCHSSRLPATLPALVDRVRQRTNHSPRA